MHSQDCCNLPNTPWDSWCFKAGVRVQDGSLLVVCEMDANTTDEDAARVRAGIAAEHELRLEQQLKASNDCHHVQCLL